MEIYISGKKEYINIDGQISSALCGISLIDYIYGDFSEVYDMMAETYDILRHIRSGKDVGENIAKLKDYAEFIEKQHIYFHTVSEYIYAVIKEYEQTKQIDNVKYLARMWAEIRDLQGVCLKLVEQCFDMDDDSMLSTAEKYLGFLKQQGSAMVFEPKIYAVTLKAVQSDGTLVFVDAATPHDFFDAIYYFASYFLKNDVKFRKCKYCGKYFVPETGRMDYCERRIEGSSKTCRDLGCVKNYQAKAFNHEAAKVYNRAYKTMFSRLKSKRHPLTEPEFKAWAVEARTFRDKCNPDSSDYDINLNRFKLWLEETV